MSATGIEPGYAWFGHKYTPVWRVFIDGRQVGVWTKRRWAKRNLREQLRAQKHAKEGGGHG